MRLPIFKKSLDSYNNLSSFHSRIAELESELESEDEYIKYNENKFNETQDEKFCNWACDHKVIKSRLIDELNLVISEWNTALDDSKIKFIRKSEFDF